MVWFEDLGSTYTMHVYSILPNAFSALLYKIENLERGSGIEAMAGYALNASHAGIVYARKNDDNVFLYKHTFVVDTEVETVTLDITDLVLLKVEGSGNAEVGVIMLNGDGVTWSISCYDASIGNVHFCVRIYGTS